MMKMKISLSFVIRTLAVINLFLPICTAICYCFGYKFSLFSYSILSVILSVISVASVIYVFKTKQKPAKKSDKVLLALMPLFCIINWVVYLFKSTNKAVITVFMPFCFVCAIIFVVKNIRPVILKISSILIPSLAIIPIAFLTFLLLLPMVRKTVVKTIPSPEGTYYAEITYVDSGTFGGDTLVHIHETKILDFLIFNITKSPRRVYIGDWKEYETMQIYWKNEHYLVINEFEYSIE